RFPKGGLLDNNAGISFIKELKKDDYTVPIALQSNNEDNRIRAESLGVFFINKNSRKVLKTIRNFMLNYLGFGDFKFRLSDGTIVGNARNIVELAQSLATVPEESLIYHGTRDHFSGWLMNRGEFAIAQKLKPRKVSEFTNTSELRELLLSSVNAILTEKTGGVINDFSRENYHHAIRYIRLRPGSLGGKGRGIAFLQYLLNSFLLVDELSKVVSIRIPKTFVIGTDEFDHFMDENEDLYEIALSDASDDKIKASFLKASLHYELVDDLSYILEALTGPLSVRSSSLLEDSQYQPFAGVFETYMLPNNQDLETRVKLLCGAIKLVYASSFLRQAKSYAESTGQSVEESKMAVVIQQVVGKRRPQNLSYPCFSGVATSYNYYPISYMKPEDRIVFLALGLGKTIVDGGLSVRFCPKYPEVSFYSTQDQVFANSQKDFFAIDLQSENLTFDKGEESFLKKVSIFDADPNTLANVADTFDYNDDILRPGFHGQGAPVITFNNHLKYDKFPFAELITKILSLGERTMGSSVEIEFAGNFQSQPHKTATFYLLQIRPYTQFDVILNDERKNYLERDLFIKSTLASGNRVITDILDVVFVKPETFDKLKTQEMVTEVDKINKILKEKKRPYILIGFGRWGTFDTSLGIPVKWDNISSAQVIIEAGLKDFQIDHSQGSHFFQNITTANIGYLYVKFKSEEDMIDWKWLSEQENTVFEYQYVKHIRTANPFYIRIDGRKREGTIYKPD
ncbi:MAG: PEP/pyruvate-binding domain-containing protein, partial [Candidatus Kariarchaeaceae archaeon]